MLRWSKRGSRRANVVLGGLVTSVGALLVIAGSPATANTVVPGGYQDVINEGDGVLGLVAPTIRINAPSTDPAVSGQWQVLGYQMPIRGIHFAVLKTGNVLICAGSGNVRTNNEQRLDFCAIWYVSQGLMKKIQIPDDLFCSGHTELPDGKALFNGGTNFRGFTGDNGGKWGGLNATYEFDPTTETFTRYANMIAGRWYPTTITLGNGKALTVAGFEENGSPNPYTEVYDPATHTWTQVGPQKKWPLYPNLKLLADGNLFYTGASTSNRSIELPGEWNPYTGAYTNVPGLTSVDHRNQAGAVLLPPAQLQRFAVLGGGSANGSAAIADTNFIDMLAASPKYVSGPPLAVAKGYVSTSVLPDYTVFETGGSSVWRSGNVFEASILDPVTRTFTEMASDPVGRNYHSSAFLLPDGRVAALGSNPGDGTFEMRISIFSPPYLFKGTRPSITVAPTEIHYGGTVSITSTDSGSVLTKMALIRNPIETHQNKPDERLVDLPGTFTNTSAVGTVTTNPNLAPPGYYYLVVDNAAGIPSIAKIVHLS